MSAILPCPGCRGALRPSPAAVGARWECRTCAARLVDLPFLRAGHDRDAIDAIWQVACSGRPAAGTACPRCRQRMLPVTMRHIRVEVCRPCRCVLADDAVLARMRVAEPPPAPAPPPPPPPPPPAEPTPQERMNAALARREQEGEAIGDGPDERWKWVMGFLGFPVKMGRMATERIPAMTFFIIAACLVTTAIAMSAGLDGKIAAWGFIPEDPLRAGGLTALTAFFLHAGPMHLIGNGWFLYLTGENVEDRYGTARFCVLLLSATLAGHIAHLCLDPRWDIPCVGASGGIAGVMACFSLTYRRAQIGQAWFFGRIWVRMPAWAWFATWVGGQLLLAWMQIGGFTNISAGAHLGGAAAGAVCWRLWSTGVRQGV